MRRWHWESHSKWSLLVHLSKWFTGNGWQRFLSWEEFKGEPRSSLRKVLTSAPPPLFFFFWWEFIPSHPRPFPVHWCYKSQVPLHWVSVLLKCTIKLAIQRKTSIFPFTVLGKMADRLFWTKKTEDNSEHMCWGQEMQSQKLSSGGSWAELMAESTFQV